MGNSKGVHSGHRQRLKQLVRENGFEGMSAYQVLEVLLYYAVPQRDTNELAHTLIDHFGSLPAVLNADYEDLLSLPGVGPNTASLLTLMPALYRRYSQDSTERGCVLNTQQQAVDYLRNFFIGKTYEEFYLICLDSQLHVNRAELINRGSLTHVTVYPRIVVEAALRHKARYVLLAHNHPGGRLQPSADDVKVTDAICSVLEALSITVLDHVIVGSGGYFSFAEKGLLPKRL
ncbi:MAG: DNA repair protein RadC [Firmicutes bacterium]|nr:DNA repair protein RadC [Bacillota bacterium]